VTRGPPGPAERGARLQPWLAAIVGAVLLVGVVGLLAQNLRNDFSTAHVRAGILASGIAEAVSRRIEGIDFALAGLAARIDPGRLDDPAHVRTIHQALVAARGLSRDANAFIVIDRAGWLVATSRVPPDRTERANLADRPVFAPIAADPDSGLHISRPYPALLGNLANQPILTLGRALRDTEGRFAGVVAAVLPGSGSRGLLPEMPLPPDVIVRLVRRDGVLLEERLPADETPEGLASVVPPAAVLAGDARSGAFVTASAGKGPVFLAAWQVVDAGRAVVLTGISRSSVIADWAKVALPVTLAGTVLAGALLLLALHLSRTIGRLDSALADLAAREGEMRTIADSLGIVLWLRPRRLEGTRYRGAAAERMTGRSIAELESRPFYWREEVTHPEDREGLQRSYRGVDLSEGWRHVYRIVARDGTVRWIEDRAVQIKGPDGDGPVYGAITDITELREARERLNRQERQLADAARIAGLCFWRLAEGSDRFEWGEESYRQFGVDPARFVPTSDAIMPMIEPEDRPKVAEALARVRATGESESYVYRLRRPDGSLRVRWSLASAEHDETGRLVAITGVSQDITDRERLHAALTQQQIQLAEAGRVAGIGFWRLRKGSDLLEWTDEVYRQMGETRATFVPTLEALYERILPEDREPTRAVAERVWRTGEADSVVYRIRRPDGEIRWRWVSFAVERGPEGEIVAVAGASQDITEHRLASERLARQERQIADAGRIARIGFYRRDLATGAIACTAEFLDQHGLAPDAEVDIAALRRLVHPDDLARLDQTAARIIETGETATLTYRIIRPDGAIRSLRATIGIDRALDGSPTAVSALFQDVTDEVAAREELDRQRHFLDAARRIGRLNFWRLPLDDERYTWTDTLYEEYGVDPAGFEPTRANVFALIHPEDRAAVTAAGQHVRRTGESSTARFRIIRPDGTVRWRHSIVGLERGADGTPIALVGVTQDITEEVQARAQSERQQRFLDAARRVGHVGFYWRAIDSDTYTWTEEIYAGYGVDPARFVPTRAAVRAMAYPEDLPLIDAAAARLREVGESGTVTYRIIRADGAVRWRRATAGLEYGPDGTPLGLVGVSQDVTEEVEARAQLERQQRFLDAARRVGRIGFFRRLLDGSPSVWTEEIYRDFGVDPARFIPTVASVRTMVHPDDLPLFDEANRRLAEEGEGGTHTYRIIRPDGQVRWRRTVSGVERRPDGTPLAVIGVAQDVTEEIEARERIAEQARRLSEMGRVARIGFYRRALDGRQMVATAEKLRQFGLPPDSGPLDVSAFRAVMHPEDVGRVEAAGRRIAETGESETVTFRVCRPDGSVRWLRIVAGLERDAEGRPIAVTGLSQDVTEEVEAAEQIRQRDKLLADAGRVARLGFWRRRLDEETIVWSDEVYRYYGLEPGSIVPTVALIRERLHPDDITVWQEARKRLHETGENQTITVRIRRPDGTWRWIRDSVGMEHGPDGVTTVYGIAQDVTAEIEARERLERQQHQLAEAGRVAGLGFWRLTLGGDTFELSSAIYDQLGVTPQTFTSSSEAVFGLMPEEDRAAVRAVLDRVAETGEQSSVAYRIRRPDGVIRHRSSTVGLERAPDGTPVALVGVSTDITDRVEQEARLERAQRLNALGELTGGIAHDVNNLLSVIGLNLELLREQAPSAEAQELTDAALHAVAQGAKLARGLLAFAQRQSLRPSAVPLAPLLAGLEALLRRALGGRIVLQSEIAPDTPPALADPALLETSLVNLVLNARDAMPDGGEVTIRAAPAMPGEAAALGLAPAPHVRLSVTDEGEGMAPDVLARAFEPFFTTKGAGKGTGLGLAMVYGFARQSGGEIRIDSTPGAGTTVTLWLPAAAAPAAQDETGAVDHTVLARIRLLVVEDEPPLRALVERICREAGMEVSAVADGDNALALLRYGVRIDLMLTDIRMPGRLDGHALAAEARALRPGLPVVLMTGFDDTGLADAVLPVVRKPFTRGALLDALAAALLDAGVAAK
jgi:PAS domain S-box-containing protein